MKIKRIYPMGRGFNRRKRHFFKSNFKESVDDVKIAQGKVVLNECFITMSYNSKGETVEHIIDCRK